MSQFPETDSVIVRRPMPRWMWAFVAVVIGIHASLLVYCARTDSVTCDEPLHLLAGYSSLALRDFGFSIAHHHPAFGTMVNAIPLLFVRDLKTPPTARQGGNPEPWKTQFLFGQSVSADRLLFWCRVPTMLMSMALCLLVFIFARDVFGWGAAALALLLQAFSPNIIAHGH